MIVGIASLQQSTAQIEVGVVGATTFNQVNGDNAMGFGKKGFTTGLQSNLMFGNRVGLTTGLMFAQKGSIVPEAFQNRSTFGAHTSLNYLEAPLLIRYQSDHGLFMSGGLTFGRLLNATLTSFGEEKVNYENIEAAFNPWEIGMQALIGYRINDNLEAAAGWGQSVNNIFTQDIPTKNGMQNQQFLLKLVYYPKFF